MKKHIYLIISVILIVVCLFVSADYSVVKIKNEAGKDEKIENPNEMLFLLNSFSSSNGFLRNLSANKMANFSDMYTSNLDKDYSSITLECENFSEVITSEMYQKLHVKKSCYFSEKSSYYIADALISVNAHKDSKSAQVMIKFKAEIYHDDDYSIIKFSELNISPSVPMSDFELKTWYDIDGFDSILSSTEALNNDFLNDLKIILNSDNMFDINDSIYTVKDEKKVSVFNIISNQNLNVSEINDKANLNFCFDFSNPTTPIVKDELSYNDSELKIKAYDYIKFKNINNTAIELPKNIKVKELNYAWWRFEDSWFK